MTRLRSHLVKLLLLSASLLVSFLAVEAAVRILYGNPQRFLSPQVRHILTPYGYKLEPGQRGSYTLDKPVRTNSVGFRDSKEWTVPKPEGTFRIMVLGDSFTFGNGVNAEERFSDLLEERLGREGMNVEVLNAAAGGWNLRNQHPFFKTEGLTYEPDALVVAFFPNDWMTPPPPGEADPAPVTRLTSEGRQEGRPRWLRWLPYEAIFKLKYSAAVVFLRGRIAAIQSAPGIDSKLVDNQVSLDDEPRIAYSYEKYADMKALCDERGIPMIIASIPPVNFFWVSTGTPRYVEHFRQFSEANGITFVDLSEELATPKGKYPFYMYPWDNHLNPEGHRRVADQLFPVLDRLIPRPGKG